MDNSSMDRRTFVGQSVGAGAAVALGTASLTSLLAQTQQKRVRVGVIGCGSVSNAYLPQLSQCPFAEVVSTCDIIPERAERRAKEFKVPNHYPHIDKMLAGEPFDFLVNLTDMQEHEHLNREDLVQSSIVMATFLWQAANREELLPRKPFPTEPVKKQEPTPPAEGAH